MEDDGGSGIEVKFHLSRLSSFEDIEESVFSTESMLYVPSAQSVTTTEASATMRSFSCTTVSTSSFGNHRMK